jgi:serine/threonine-protein kinase SRPK3
MVSVQERLAGIDSEAKKALVAATAPDTSGHMAWEFADTRSLAADFHKSYLEKSVASVRGVVADLGNALWARDDNGDSIIQTRQYRSPEVILGCKYDCSVDIFSMGCMVFELLTGDFLFYCSEDVHGNYEQTDDHLALMLEAMDADHMPSRLVKQGTRGRNYCTSTGALKRLPSRMLKPWNLFGLLHVKHGLDRDTAAQAADFLTQCLQLDPKRRASAEQLLLHPWLAAETTLP